MTRLSLRSRLTLWYTVALLVVLCLFGANVLWQQRRIGFRRVDRELEALTATLANMVQEELNEQDDPVTAATEATTAVTAPGRALAIADEDGKVLGARWNHLDLPGPIAADGEPSVRTIQSNGVAWRVHTRPRAFGNLTLVLVVATPVSDVLREQREVQEAMMIGIPIVLLLAAAGGLWLASVGLRPIADMAGRAARIAPTGLDDLGQTDRTDELGQLATAFNGLVARLRATLQTQRQFMADASHELRTPVSVVRATSDVTLSRGHRDEPEYREALAIVGGQARRLGRLVEDMLVLARADAGGYPLRPVDLYLDEVVAECRRAVDVLATERGVAIRAAGSPDIPFRGDEDLLRRLVLNVLQNAVQHTPTGGSVAVDIHQEPAAVRIRVTDEGPGIPTGDQQRIFDRFVQLDAARRGQGAGLGLPIARWIAEAHKGTLVLEHSGPEGSTFCVWLPTPATT
ncbi:MAG TPA: ATP-binding protein [Vicinamibacterales bacterium]|nr:ATP-binding protein [Vicinamibacterales bacterium]